MNTPLSPEDLVVAANSAIAKKEYDEASRLLESALSYAPQSPFLLATLAKVSSNGGNWPRALLFGRQALAYPLPPDEFAQVAWALCIAAYTSEGEFSARQEYLHVLPGLKSLFDGKAIPKDPRACLDYSLHCALSASDRAFVEFLFRSRQSASPWAHLPVATSKVTTLQAWLENAEAPLVHLDLPERIAQQNDTPLHVSWDYKTEGYSVATVANAEILSGWDFVVAPSGEVIADSGYSPIAVSYNWLPQIYVPPLGRVIHFWPDGVLFIDEAVLFLSCPETFHFGHWLVDFLPRLRVLIHRPELKVMVPTELPQKMYDLLPLFGIDEGRVVRCDLGRRYRFRELVIARPGNEKKPVPENIHFVSKALRGPQGDTSRSSRLFVVRAVNTRNIVNQDELNILLKELGFEKINLAALSIAEQQKRFGDAEIVLGVHGSDLLALFFMQEGADLIELNWKHDATALGPYSSFTGLNFHLLICREAEEASLKIYKKDRDVIVDLEALRQLLHQIISRNESLSA